MRAIHLVRKALLLTGTAVVLGGAWVGYQTWPRKLNLSLPPCLPKIQFTKGFWVVQTRTDALLAKVESFRSELRAYLHFEYLKSHAGLAGSQVLLTGKPSTDGPRYEIFLVLDNNLLSAVPKLAQLSAKGYISGFELEPSTYASLARKRLETAAFLAAYNPSRAPELAALRPAQLLLPLARFLAFKSATDRRVREHLPPVPTTLSERQAEQLAGDIIEVARFYQLPLDVFLGIGAMENNYMNVRGDLEHAVWKRRPQRGDIILERRRGRVLVSDYAMGVWQITRETLRYAHRLYLKDKRDYSVLPPYLRPSKQLNFDMDNSEVLTTYAGLLLRHLLDQSDGNIQKAVGAYNGSLRNPNYAYAAGVEAVATYARSFLECASNLGGMSVAKSWLTRESRYASSERLAKTRVAPVPPAASIDPE